MSRQHPIKQWASHAVAFTQQSTGISLDYSPQSLQVVDHLLDDLSRRWVHTEQVHYTLLALGCYVGEVLARHLNGRWQQVESPAQLPKLDIGRDLTCDPIRLMFKRFECGASYSPVRLFNVLASCTRRSWFKRHAQLQSKAA